MINILFVFLHSDYSDMIWQDWPPKSKTGLKTSLPEFKSGKVPPLQGRLVLRDRIKVITFSTNSSQTRSGQHPPKIMMQGKRDG
jgi:hypothetical protein